jgi:hypothetical protein
VAAKATGNDFVRGGWRNADRKLLSYARLGILLVKTSAPLIMGTLMPMPSCQNAPVNLLKPHASSRKAQAS